MISISLLGYVKFLCVLCSFSLFVLSRSVTFWPIRFLASPWSEFLAEVFSVLNIDYCCWLYFNALGASSDVFCLLRFSYQPQLVGFWLLLNRIVVFYETLWKFSCQRIVQKSCSIFWLSLVFEFFQAVPKVQFCYGFCILGFTRTSQWRSMDACL